MSESDNEILITTDSEASKGAGEAQKTEAEQEGASEQVTDILIEEVKQGKQRVTKAKLANVEREAKQSVEPKKTERVTVCDWVYKTLTLGGFYGNKDA